MKILFVFNPKSGRGQIKNSLLDIVDTFVKGGYENVEVYPTQMKDDACRKIKEEGKNFDTVCVCGGDGTLNEAVCALMSFDKEKRPKLGYIPAGTTNDFAASCNIPKNDMVLAAKSIVESDCTGIDIGKIGNDKYFSYIAAFGAFTEVSYETPQQTKNVLGYAAYVLEGIKRIGNIKPHHIKLLADGKEIEGDFIYAMVSNSFSVGGVKYSGDVDISLNDGVFECLLIKNTDNPLDFQFVIADLLTSNLKSDKFILFKTSKLSFESDEELDWTVDGEFGGKYKKVEIENCKCAINIFANME